MYKTAKRRIAKLTNRAFSEKKQAIYCLIHEKIATCKPVS